MDERIRWIFFDVGATLMDETKAYEHRVRDAIEGTDITFEQFWERMISIAERNPRCDIETIEHFGLKKTLWHTEDEVPYPCAEDVLKLLCDRGYRLGIIANQKSGLKERLERWGLAGYFDIIASSSELGISKPDRRIFDKALEMAGCMAQEAAMVGDRLDNDIVPAKRLGMTTVWVRQGFAMYQKPRSVEEQPDYTIDSLSELDKLFQRSFR